MRQRFEQFTRPLPMLALSVAAFPMLVILDLLGYALEAGVYLGHWPSYANPDPKQLGWWLQHSALELGFVGFPAASFLGVCLAILGRTRSRDFPFWTVIITTVASIALLVAFARIDPGGVVAWFWD
jgi:hypothetical protein